MIPVTTKGVRKKGVGVTIRQVLVLISVTSFVWVTIDLAVINLNSNRNSAADNHKLPLDGDNASPYRIADDNFHIPGERNVLIENMEVDGASRSPNRTEKKALKPKLARLLGKRRELSRNKPVGEHRNRALTPHSNISRPDSKPGNMGVASNDTRIAAKNEKISTTEGFHLVQAFDVTSYPRNTSGIGEGGVAVDMGPGEQERMNAQWAHNYFNEYLSDRISVERSLPDHRHQECKNLKISNNLPKTSVIICFCEESWSTLLRTVHSVINRSPPELLEEIILVDDFSQRDHLKKPLDEYMARFPKVKVVHLRERHGLVRARLVGVEISMASVLTFLDSHIECTVGWLEPLLQRVHEDRRNVVCPSIGTIDSKTFKVDSIGNQAVGSFSWLFAFIWGAVPDHEKKRRKHHYTSPIRSPTMAGGLFSIDKKFFYELGLYDTGFEVWGAENLELSFKTWMCGGQLEILPCSKVCHIFRKAQPYSFPNNDNARTFYINTMRMVEVWVDEPYKRIFYDKIPSLKGVDPGDLTDRKAIRQMLQCKDFQWYLDNVHPGRDIPEFIYRARGMVRNGHYKMICLDNMKRLVLGAYPCHGLDVSQMFYHKMRDVITNEDYCCNPTEDGSLTKEVCNFATAAKYTHERGGPIIEKASGKCLDLSITSEANIVKLEECNGKDTQKWNWEHYYDEKGIEIY